MCEIGTVKVNERAGRREVVVRAWSDRTSDYKGGAVLGGSYSHWCVPCLQTYHGLRVTYLYLQLPKEALYTCSRPKQTYTPHVLGGEVRARVHLGSATNRCLGSPSAGCPAVHEKCVLCSAWVHAPFLLQSRALGCPAALPTLLLVAEPPSCPGPHSAGSASDCNGWALWCWHSSQEGACWVCWGWSIWSHAGACQAHLNHLFPNSTKQEAGLGGCGTERAESAK